MKTYKKLYEQMIPPDIVCKCALDAAESKTQRSDVQKSLINFDQTYDYVMKCINDENYNPCENNVHEIIDGANNKQREIEKPNFCPEQIIHHMLIEPFKEVLLNGLYEHVYGCLPPDIKNGKIKKFGPHAAITRLRKWVQTGEKLYICETDIHHAYASVHIPTLVNQLNKVIKDQKWLNLMYKFLHYGKSEYGLILGHYTSPWLFNFYLKKLDHVMAQTDGIKYLRFADNIYMISTNKRKLHRALNFLRDYLKNELHMELNKCTQIYRFEYVDKNNEVKGRAINALGAVIHYNRVTLRKSILKRMRRKANRINKKKGKEITWHDGASMLSRLAWIRFTHTYTYYKKYIKCKINTRLLKKKVRKHSRNMKDIIIERRKKIYDGLANSARLAGK